MIFNCPECSAGHSVPVSMIPNGGLDMDCRRCGEAFTIEPPSEGEQLEDTSDDSLPPDLDVGDPGDIDDVQGEKTSVGPAPVPEQTRVGVANPLEFEDEAPLIGPGGIEHRTDEFAMANHVPLSDAEMGLDPELDETMRFDRPDDVPPFASPQITEPGLIERPEISVVASIPSLAVRPTSTSGSTPSVYERVAAGIPVPEEVEEGRKASASLPPERRSLFQPVIDLLNRAPLALKVGLIVFPVTLGVMLVFNSMSEDDAPADHPIEIPIAADAPPPPALRASDAPPPLPKVEEPPPSPPPPAQAIDDAPAPAGFAYVQIEDARLRVKPGEKSGIAGRVQIGGLVKVYDDIGEFSLVASLPEGPAGFLNKKLLGPRKPLALLARDQTFERCSAEEGYSIDDCLFAAKQQEQPCLDRCGAVSAGNEAERLRCAEVCSIAFDSCARSCRQAEQKLAKGKKKRR